MTPIFQPNRPKSIITATSLIKGAAIRKEKVTPRGIPLSTKPMNSGMAEHEQKGVMIPNVPASILPVNKDFPSKAFLVFSGEKNDLTIPIRKMIRISRRIIFIKVLMKKHMELARRLASDI